MLLSPLMVFAYVGPGAGFTVIGSTVVFLAVVAAAIVGFLWYPISLAYRAIARRKRSATPARDA